MVISDFASNVRRLLRLGRGRKKLTYTTKVVVEVTLQVTSEMNMTRLWWEVTYVDD